MGTSATVSRSSSNYLHSQRGADLRWGSLIGGGVLAAFGLSRRSKAGLAIAAAGGALAYAGARANAGTAPEANGSVVINCSPDEAYRRWRNLADLPQFMHHLESVTVLDDRRSRWVAVGPAGARVEWTAEIFQERPGELLAWRSVEGSEIDLSGRVTFRPATGNRGTLLTATTHFENAISAAAQSLATIFGKDPSFLMQQDLRRFKALIEAGEIPTIEGQPHGPRSAAIGAMRLLDPDRDMSVAGTLADQRTIA
jgi:uncharacterized membrane protein